MSLKTHKPKALVCGCSGLLKIDRQYLVDLIRFQHYHFLDDKHGFRPTIPVHYKCIQCGRSSWLSPEQFVSINN